MEDIYNGTERREFTRLDFVTPLDFKVCKKTTIAKLIQGYTVNISEAGLRCNIKDRVNMDDILWISFDRTTLNIYEGLEKRVIIYQNGIIGKVVRIDPADDQYDVGIQFLTREEKNLTHIYSNVHFILNAGKKNGS